MKDLPILGERGTGQTPGGVEQPVADTAPATAPAPSSAEEFGGRDGPDPTRYGDWEKNGRCIDF